MTDQVYQPLAGATAINDTDAKDYHQRWLVIDDNDVWLDSDNLAGLAELDISIKFGYLVIRAPGMLRLDIPMDVIEDDSSVERSAKIGTQSVRVVDEGELACAWFSQWADRPCRLVKIHPDAGAIQWPAK